MRRTNGFRDGFMFFCLLFIAAVFIVATGGSGGSGSGGSDGGGSDGVGSAGVVSAEVGSAPLSDPGTEDILPITGQVTSISVTPANPSVPAGLTKQFVAIGTYSDGTTRNMSTLVTWSSSDTSVATVNTSGPVTGVQAGTAVITATWEGISGDTILAVTPGMWTWVSGGNTANEDGIYGIKGGAASTNIPGAREAAVTWLDPSGTFWLFGGLGYDMAHNWGYLNDLWKYDGTNWTWVSGSNTVNQEGVYGTKGVAASTNVPGARVGAVSWVDSSGTRWLFGGLGWPSAGNSGYLNDLWKYDGTNWTWVSGSNTVNQEGVYGTKGVAASTNVPGARVGAVSWVDSSGNRWLFGGYRSDLTGNSGSLNDLWKYDGTNWTWVSGSNTVNQEGVYGTKGVAASTNVPGARSWSASWIDSSGALWLFGGNGYHTAGNSGYLNDLWTYDGTNWTWVSGSNTINQEGVYGTKGVAASTNIPGAREAAVYWIDSSGALWLLGGNGYDMAGDEGYLNDLWTYDGTDWTWVSGSDTVNQEGVYGTKGVAASTTVPGARFGAVSWVDSSGALWLFGGYTYHPTESWHLLNDLWKYQ